MNDMKRRTFLHTATTGLIATGLSSQSLNADTKTGASGPKTHTIIVPPRIKKGDLVGIVAPASVTYKKQYLELAKKSLEALGLKVKIGRHVLERYGYLAGDDEARASDIMDAFTNPDIRAIFCLRGGWGAARLLPHLDYETIRKNPKPLIGYSDVTSLLNAIYTKSGLVTYHGPNAGSPWHDFSVQKMSAILFDGQAITIPPNIRQGDTLVPRQGLTQVVNEGQASGRLIGGNLSVLTSILGSPYMPDMTGHILCLEEIGEYIYRCDRMLTALSLAGVFDKVSGVVLGGFTGCGVDPTGGFGTFSLMDVFEQHFSSKNIPVYYGAPFGHISEKYTLPFGVEASMNANTGTLELKNAPAF